LHPEPQCPPARREEILRAPVLGRGIAPVTTIEEVVDAGPPDRRGIPDPPAQGEIGIELGPGAKLDRALGEDRLAARVLALGAPGQALDTRHPPADAGRDRKRR